MVLASILVKIIWDLPAGVSKTCKNTYNSNILFSMDQKTIRNAVFPSPRDLKSHFQAKNVNPSTLNRTPEPECEPFILN